MSSVTVRRRCALAWRVAVAFEREPAGTTLCLYGDNKNIEDNASYTGEDSQIGEVNVIFGAH